jgi:hypothetical protein
VQRHFYALREAKPDIVGVAVFDRLGRQPTDQGVTTLVWTRREIENYLTTREVLENWARGDESDDLFTQGRLRAMQAAIGEVETAQRTLGRDIWSGDIKATDEVLDPIYRRYFELTRQPLLFRKSDYHRLVRFIDASQIDPEVGRKLDEILATANSAKPRTT